MSTFEAKTNLKNLFSVKFGIFVSTHHFWQIQAFGREYLEYTEAVFLVMCDPSMNEL
jgi:hypothetical protein